jgi:hypothetical protein
MEMKYPSLLAVVGITVVLSVPLIYASYLVYKKQQALLSVLRSGRKQQQQQLKRTKSPARLGPDPDPYSDYADPNADADDSDYHDVGLDLDSIPMFTPRNALII